MSDTLPPVFVFAIIIVAFVVCWLPAYTAYIVMNMWPEVNVYVSPGFVMVVWWMAYFSSAFNPIIYTTFNKEFR